MRTRVTVEFDVDDDDVCEVADTIAYNLTTSEFDKTDLTNPATALSMLIQVMLYDVDEGPMLRGEYRIVTVKDITK